MAHLYYDDNIITSETSAPGSADSFAGPGEHDSGVPDTSRFAALSGRVWQLMQRERALLISLSKFLVVGGTGVLVNSFVLFLLFQWVHLPLVMASVLSAELAIVNNFWWNDRWTFSRTQLSLRRFAQFNLVSLFGLVLTTGTLWVLVHYLGLYYLAANLVGIALAAIWGFAANSLWTWGGAR
jgi:putative flippase GtrA